MLQYLGEAAQGTGWGAEECGQMKPTEVCDPVLISTLTESC